MAKTTVELSEATNGDFATDTPSNPGDETLSSNGNGSTENGSFQYTNETGGEPPKKRRGRPPKDPNKTSTTVSTKSTKKVKKLDPEKVTNKLLEKFEDLTTKILNKDTSFTSDERFFIEPALQEFIGEIDLDVERYSKVILAGSLLLGMGMWYIRVVPTSLPKQEKKQANVNHVPETMVNQQASHSEVTREDFIIPTVENPFG